MKLSRLYDKVLNRPLKLYWWRYEYPHKLNFGDEITPFLIERLTNRRVIWSSTDRCDVAGAGSIVEVLQSYSRRNHIKVWGSGFIKDGGVNPNRNLEFVAVRGHLSLERISGRRNIPLGDPGLLMSRALPLSVSPSVEMPIGIIAHYVDKNLPVLRGLVPPRYRLIDVLDSPEAVARQICQCSLVLSSSLHGLIVSDSYGVPNCWLRLSDNLTGGDYKFRDYYSVFGVEPRSARLDRITDNGYLAELRDAFAPRANISSIQDRLLSVLPA
jgi:hypothetical protein